MCLLKVVNFVINEIWLEAKFVVYVCLYVDSLAKYFFVIFRAANETQAQPIVVKMMPGLALKI